MTYKKFCIRALLVGGSLVTTSIALAQGSAQPNAPRPQAEFSDIIVTATGGPPDDADQEPRSAIYFELSAPRTAHLSQPSFQRRWRASVWQP